jgi:proteic killer suppression protein
MSIISFKCPDTERLFTTGKSKSISAFKLVAERKLAQLDAAAHLDFLRTPPGNRLEALKGSRVGQYSIRINDQ